MISKTGIRWVLSVLVASRAGRGGQTGTAESVTAFESGGDGGPTHISRDLDTLLENGGLDGAWERYESDSGSRRRRRVCGKSVFFSTLSGPWGRHSPSRKRYILVAFVKTT